MDQGFKKIVLMLPLAASGMLMSFGVLAHCQIPCGIYDDHAGLKACSKMPGQLKSQVN